MMMQKFSFDFVLVRDSGCWYILKTVQIQGLKGSKSSEIKDVKRGPKLDEGQTDIRFATSHCHQIIAKL